MNAAIIFYVDAAHTRKERGTLTGKVHRSDSGSYIGHEILVRGRLYSVPRWRFTPH